VFYYQSNSPCNRTFIRVRNENVELEKSIQQLFNEIDVKQIVSSVDYQFNSHSFRRIKTYRTHHGYFHGSSILAVNKLLTG